MSSRQQKRKSLSNGKVAILLGATGAVGSSLLSALLASGAYGQVHAFVRKPFKSAKGLEGDERVFEHIVDFDKLLGVAPDVAETQKFQRVRADDVYVALGTTRAQAGSAAAFEKIDREYVVGAARASLLATTTTTTTTTAAAATADGQGQGGGGGAAAAAGQHQQRIVYCSSAGANSSSPFLYTKSKGLTEDALTKLGYSQTFIFRPGFLANATREKPRRAEAIFGWFTSNVLSKVSDGVEIGVSPLAKAMVWACLNGVEGLDGRSLGTRISPAGKNQGLGQGQDLGGASGPTAVLINNAEATKIANSAELLQ